MIISRHTNLHRRQSPRSKCRQCAKKMTYTNDFLVWGVLLILLPVRLTGFACVRNYHHDYGKISTKFHSSTLKNLQQQHPQQQHQKNSHFTKIALAAGASSTSDQFAKTTSEEPQRYSRAFLANAYKICGVLSAISWIVISWVALSYHPDPKFADCTLRHNLLTMSQAYAFPLPVGWAVSSSLLSLLSKSTSSSESSNNQSGDSQEQQLLQSATITAARRLHLGVTISSLWLAASVAFAPAFAFGYDLYTAPLKVVSTGIHSATALVAFAGWKRSVSANVQSSSLTPVVTRRSLPYYYYLSRVIRGTVGSLWKISPATTIQTENYDDKDDAALYATCTVGLLWFTILPIISPYPLVTIPTILGKRLSRPATAFTFLGAIAAYCLKDVSDVMNIIKHHKKKENESDGAIVSSAATAAAFTTFTTKLKKGLAIGSAAHLLLIALKIIGVDGGGLLLPGRGLWEVYPAMVAVPFATASSIAVYALLCFTTTS